MLEVKVVLEPVAATPSPVQKRKTPEDAESTPEDAESTPKGTELEATEEQPAQKKPNQKDTPTVTKDPQTQRTTRAESSCQSPKKPMPAVSGAASPTKKTNAEEPPTQRTTRANSSCQPPTDKTPAVSAASPSKKAKAADKPSCCVCAGAQNDEQSHGQCSVCHRRVCDHDVRDKLCSVMVFKGSKKVLECIRCTANKPTCTVCKKPNVVSGCVDCSAPLCQKCSIPYDQGVHTYLICPKCYKKDGDAHDSQGDDDGVTEDETELPAKAKAANTRKTRQKKFSSEVAALQKLSNGIQFR